MSAAEHDKIKSKRIERMSAQKQAIEYLRLQVDHDSSQDITLEVLSELIEWFARDLDNA